MRYSDGDRQSDQVEDRRGEDNSGLGRRGGMQIPIPLGGGGMSLTTIVVVGIICLMLGINPLSLLTGGGIEIPNMPRPESTPRRNSQEVPGMPRQPRVAQQNDEMSKFVSHVLADTEDVWEQIFKNARRTYEKPKLVIFSGATDTRCGPGQSAMGPFYCPLDRTVYIDLSFYEELKRRFNAPGDFAQAYVIAHEVGHHVQTLLGISDKVMALRQKASSQAAANQLQVRMELQADCFAGVWANLNDQMKSRLEPGDVEKGLAAAAAIGDDTLQRRSTGRVVPESFTHGTSAQRVAWFKKGLETGRTQACDTFNSADQ
jgi:predicted metalloprotease